MHLLLPFGDHLISVDRNNVVIIWDVESEGWFVLVIILASPYLYIPLSHMSWSYLVPVITDTYLQLSFDKVSFDVSAVMHPSTYLNKVLFGSSHGSLQLWNIKSKYAPL